MVWFVAGFCWDILTASALHLCVNVCSSCVLNYIRAVKGKCMAQQESAVWSAISPCICSAVTKPQKPFNLLLCFALFFLAPLPLCPCGIPVFLLSFSFPAFHFSFQHCTFMTNCACPLLLPCCMPGSLLCLTCINLRWHRYNPLTCKRPWESARRQQMYTAI